MPSSDAAQQTQKFILLNGKGGARNLSAEEAGAWQPAQGFLWTQLDYTSEEDLKLLSEIPNLDPLITEALEADEPRPRITPINDGILIALRGVNLNPGSTPDDMVAIRVYIEKTRVITTRKRLLQSITEVEEQLESGHGARDAGEFLVELVDRIVGRMSNTVDQLEDLVAELEDLTLEVQSASIRFDLANLRRQAIALRRYLAPQREALSHLIVEKTSWLTDSVRLQLREVADRLIRHIEDLDAVRERAALTQEEIQSHLSEQLNKRMYVLSVVAAIFMPLSFLTGLLGINVGGIPGASEPWAFTIFLGTLSVVVVLQILLFRWQKWL